MKDFVLCLGLELGRLTDTGYDAIDTIQYMCQITMESLKESCLVAVVACLGLSYQMWKWKDTATVSGTLYNIITEMADQVNHSIYCTWIPKNKQWVANNQN